MKCDLPITLLSTPSDHIKIKQKATKQYIYIHINIIERFFAEEHHNDNCIAHTFETIIASL